MNHNSGAAVVLALGGILAAAIGLVGFLVSATGETGYWSDPIDIGDQIWAIGCSALFLAGTLSFLFGMLLVGLDRSMAGIVEIGKESFGTASKRDAASKPAVVPATIYGVRGSVSVGDKLVNGADIVAAANGAEYRASWTDDGWRVEVPHSTEVTFTVNSQQALVVEDGEMREFLTSGAAGSLRPTALKVPAEHAMGGRA